ncbi:MAG TPA: MFS transporter [Candidatus Sulfotelmatobacter sp.]|nr:MFS transporter [Candidatus Sulfotelmatobacter sp.]
MKLTEPADPSSSGAEPARATRSAVIAALFVLSLILYIDRAAISSAKSAISTDLSLSDTAMGIVFGAFSLGYAIAQIPAGWLADRVGPRLTMAVAVALWSGFTALTGAAHQLISLVLVRFFFGAAEAAAFPSSARVFYNWLPPDERGIANGILFSGALVGGGISFPFFQWLSAAHGWRSTFYFLAVPGLIWAIAWLLWFRDYPQERVIASREPLQRGSSETVLPLLRSLAVAKAMAQYFIGNFTFFICLTWMFPYLVEHYSLAPSQAARFSMVPLLSGAAANWVSGFVVDLLYRRQFRSWSRRLPATIGFLFAALGMYAVTFSHNAEGAIAAFALATFGIEMTISPSWAHCIDIAGRNSGSASAAMNMAGSLGAFASANAFPWFFRVTGNSNAYFRIAAVLNVLAILCWLTMGLKKPCAALPD